MQFGAFGYFVSTVGINEETLANYIRKQEDGDKRLDLMSIILCPSYRASYS